MKKNLIVSLFLAFGAATTSFADAPTQVDMEKRTEELKAQRFGMFICWSFSTFSGYEWTPGVDDISFFNPTGCDPDEWCRVAKDAGMGYILFLTKHHDGFCLWDTATTERKVGNTPALKGRDVLQEVKDACDKHGLKLALYFSEGDWSWSGRKDIHHSVARPEIKKAQLKELLTKYGPIEYIWFDHAVKDGGLGHAETAAFVKSIQPACFVGYNHGDQSGADIRLGERGKAAPLKVVDAASIGSEGRAKYMKGHPGYRLAEFTYPILEGQGRSKMRGAQWFYSLPENDGGCASAEKIYKDYLGAVKYENIFSLDVGPDRSGRLRAIDVATLKKVGQLIRGEATLPVPARARASAVWEGSPEHAAGKAFDGDPATRWGAAEGDRKAWIAVDFPAPRTLTGVRIREGRWGRVEKFQVKGKANDQWQLLSEGSSLGPIKEIKFEQAITVEGLRVDILQANETPTLHEIEMLEK